jgi:hypothetical protein
MTATRRRTTLKDKTVMPTHKPHTHHAVTEHVVRQRDGVPYEFARKVCAACARVLDEKPVRRAAAA